MSFRTTSGSHPQSIPSNFIAKSESFGVINDLHLRREKLAFSF